MGADVAMAARMRLGARLKSLRVAAGITGEQAATAIRSSVAKVSRMEGGRVPAQLGDVTVLLDLYEVPESAERDALLALVSSSRKPGWWDAFSEPLPNPLRHDLSLEAAADVIEIYDSQAVPALLQTPEYARALTVTGPRPTWRAGMSPWILTRRRQLMQEAMSPRLWAVIGSAALRRPPGADVSVLRHQIEHLMSAMASTNVAIQLIPETAPIELAAPGPFTLLRFTEPGLPDLVFFEQLTGTATLDRPPDVEHYRELFGMIVVSAYTTDESRQALAEILLSLE